MINRYASLRQGLVGAWCPSLGASGYRLIDRSGYNNHGTLTNMDPGTDWVASGGKGALDFDGADDRVGVLDAPSLRPTSLSHFAWVLLKTTTGAPIQFSCKNFGVQTNESFGLWWFSQSFDSAANAWRATAGINQHTSFSIGTFPTIGRWYHIGQTFNDATKLHVLYVDGVDVANETFANGISYDDKEFTLGSQRESNAFNFFLNGQLDDVRIYNRVLTPSEIQQLYTGGRGVGLIPERIKHRRKTTAAATNRRRRILIGASS
jgi:hypothetical protein